MIIKYTTRILKEIDPRLRKIMFYNFMIKSSKCIKKFRREQKKSEKFLPAFLFISITNRCNLQCKGCWVSPTPPHDMPFEQLNKIISDAKAEKRFFFGILGGEPLLYPDIIKVFQKHQDCYFQLFTNGTLLSEDVAKQLKQCGNVTPLISLEGFEKESDNRRGGENVFQSSLHAIENCTNIGLFTGVASSICNSNFDELVQTDFLDFIISKKVHYMWYYIYRPSGPYPCSEKALSADKIQRLRQFIVNQRPKQPILIIDSYWDHLGSPLCPGAVGLSHHINPFGQLEFCPPVQFFMDTISNGNTAEQIKHSEFMQQLRIKISAETNGCILLENPKKLADIAQNLGGKDSSGRNVYKELKTLPKSASHNSIPNIPEKSLVYKIAKKQAFFGLGAYG